MFRPCGDVVAYSSPGVEDYLGRARHGTYLGCNVDVTTTLQRCIQSTLTALIWTCQQTLTGATITFCFKTYFFVMYVSPYLLYSTLCIFLGIVIRNLQALKFKRSTFTLIQDRLVVNILNAGPNVLNTRWSWN